MTYFVKSVDTKIPTWCPIWLPVNRNLEKSIDGLLRTKQLLTTVKKIIKVLKIAIKN